MRNFRIGKLFGIDLRVDWSWVFIFVLLTWNLINVFAQWHPAWSPMGRIALAFTASLLFFGCIVVHELAHSLVAMHYGVRVRSITLFLLGGVSNIEREPPSAKAEFFTAVAGPITSIALGAAFLGLASLVTTPFAMTDAEGAKNVVAQLGPFTTMLVWLGPVNIVIGVFNMIPGFPLDGGRVLRSLLWSATGSLRTATLWASVSGQAIGWMFILTGIAMGVGATVPVFGTGLAGGIWLAFIGWFLRTAASQASTKLALEDALEGLTVGQLMQRHGATAPPELSVNALVHQYLLSGDDRALPVVQDGVLLGLVSIADVRKVLPEEWTTTPVGTIMRGVEALSVSTPEQPLATAFEQIARQNIEQLPVVASGTLVGMLRRRDITRWLELAWKPTEAPAAPGLAARQEPGPPDASGHVTGRSSIPNRSAFPS